MQKIKIGILLLVIFNNCTNEINYKLKGIRGVSSSLNESKQRATFLNRYYLVNSRDDSFSIKYAFIERAFWYGNTFNETHIDLKLNDKERFQFIILFTNNGYYEEKLRLVLCNTNKYSDNTNRVFKCSLENIDIKDTIKFYMLKKYEEKKDTLGILTFVKFPNSR